MEQDISRLCRNNLPLTYCTTTKQPKLTSELWKSITKDDAVDSIGSASCIEGDSIETKDNILVSDLPVKIDVTEPHAISPSDSNKNANTFVSYFDVNQRNTEREYELIESFQEQKTIADIWNTNTKRSSLYLNHFSEKSLGDAEDTRKLIDYNASQNELNVYLEPDANTSYHKEAQNISSHVSPSPTMIYSLWEPPGHKQDCCTSMTDLCPWVYNQSQYTPWDSFLNGSSVLDSEVKNDNQARSTGGNRSQDIVSSRSFPMCRAPGSVQVPNSVLTQGNQQSDLVMLMEELALNESFKCGHENGKPLFAQHTLQKSDGASTLVKGCVFCKNNNYHSTFYRSHTLKDERGHCQCPVLRAYVCPLCNATGDAAHTLKYCPRNTVTRGDPISAGLPPGKVTNWREMANRMMHRCRKRP